MRMNRVIAPAKLSATAVIFILVGCSSDVAVAAGSVPQFDLNCAIGPDGDPQQRETYHVDLQARRWCAGACEKWSPIVSTTGNAIILTRRREHADGGVQSEDLSVNRFTGAMVWKASQSEPSGEGHATVWTGTCRPRPYSLPPRRLF